MTTTSSNHQINPSVDQKSITSVAAEILPLSVKQEPSALSARQHELIASMDDPVLEMTLQRYRQNYNFMNDIFYRSIPKDTYPIDEQHTSRNATLQIQTKGNEQHTNTDHEEQRTLKEDSRHIENVGMISWDMKDRLLDKIKELYKEVYGIPLDIDEHSNAMETESSHAAMMQE